MECSDDLINKYIQENPYRPGSGNVLIMPHGVSVWAIIAHLDAVRGSVDRVAEDYSLPVEAIKAALAYYELHKQDIDARIAANAA